MRLAVEDVDVFYDRSHVLFDVSLDVGDEVVALLGRNGAGKTTTLRAITGLTPPRRGRILFDGEDVTGDPPERIAERGLGYVPQDRRLFPDLTVHENLRMGLGTVPENGRIEALLERFPRLTGRLDQLARTLSGGERQLVAMARALAREPSLVLLDEPTEGLMPSLVPEIAESIEAVSAAGYAILLVEQRVDLALDLADRVYLMENGRIVHHATPAELRADDAALDRYLGV